MNRQRAIPDVLRERILTGQWKRGQRLATEKRIAEEFGVSAATIQRAMIQLQSEGLVQGRRGSGRFVRQDIELHRTREIMVIIARPEHMFSAPMVAIGKGIASAVQEHGYHLKFWTLPDSAARIQNQQEYINLVQRESTEGLIVATQQVSRRWLEIASQVHPVVWMHTIALPPKLSSVVTDDLGGGFLAGQHLKQLGHNHIGLVLSDVTDSISSNILDGVRLNFLDELENNQAKIHLFRTAGLDSQQCGRDAAKAWLALPKPQRPPAVFCASDDLCIGFCKTIMQAGVKIPRDVSIITHGDMIPPDTLPIAITAVHIPREDLGRRAADMLLHMIEKPTEFPEPQVVHYKLIQRDSCRPA